MSDFEQKDSAESKTAGKSHFAVLIKRKSLIL